MTRISMTPFQITGENKSSNNHQALHRQPYLRGESRNRMSDTTHLGDPQTSKVFAQLSGSI